MILALDKRKLEVCGVSTWGCSASKCGCREVWARATDLGAILYGRQLTPRAPMRTQTDWEEDSGTEASQYRSGTLGLERQDGSLSCLLGHRYHP